MRKILFRGKRADNGEWVCDNSVLFFSEKTKIYGALNEWREIEVIPETVGQYTGVIDKNGKKIFEGDIISAITLDTGNEQRAVVCFGNFIDENNGDEYIGFFIDFDGVKTTITQLAMEECKNRIEVIGNIYDNPELLKAE